MMAKKIPNKVSVRTQPCFTPLRMSKGSDAEPSKIYSALHSFMKGPDDAKESRWTSNLGKDFKKAVPQIKGLFKIHEGHKEWLLLFPIFLLQLSEGKYYVGGGSISSRSTL